MRRIIYDFGANNGDDIPYYLLKADRVVAIEANPALCQVITDRFPLQLEQGKLVLENCVITSHESEPEVEFYVHKDNHVLSQLPKPAIEDIDCFEQVLLPSKTVQGTIAEHGDPYYVKIDVEHYDSEVLHALWEAEILPPYISAESHSIEVFSLLVSMGYSAFKLVDGRSVSEVYANHLIQLPGGPISYSFPYHSAGPFGNDVDGRWSTAANFFKLLALEGLGWKDIHASRVEEPDPSEMLHLEEYFKHALDTYGTQLTSSS